MGLPWQIALVAAVLAAIVFAWLVFAVRRDPARLIRAEYARQRAACGFRVRHADIDGVRWAWVERTGATPEAPVVAMLHGYTGGKENWYRLCTALGRRYRLVVPDLPGWGESARDDHGDYGFAAQAERVAAFLRHLDAGPVVLAGHSMGGGIAALVAARHRALVSKLVLVDAAGVEFAENAFGRAVLDGDNPFGIQDDASLEQYLSVLFHERSARPPLPWPGTWAYIAHRRRESAFEQSVLERIGRGDERFLPWQEADRIAQPTLLLWGAHDRVIDPSAMALYAQRIPQARQRLLERSGHMTLMEEPAAVAEAMVALIEEASA